VLAAGVSLKANGSYDSLFFSSVHIWQMVLEVETLDPLKHLYHDIPGYSFLLYASRYCQGSKSVVDPPIHALQVSTGKEQPCSSQMACEFRPWCKPFWR